MLIERVVKLVYELISFRISRISEVVMALYIATYSLDVAALLFLLSILSKGTSLNHERKIPFIWSIVLTIVIIASEFGTILTGHENLNLRNMHILFNVLGFSLAPLISLVITLIFDMQILTSHKILIVPTLINIVLSVLSPFFNFIFYVDSQNHYMRGLLFFVFIAVYVFNYLILVMRTLDVGKKHNYPIKHNLMVLFVFTIVGTSIQLINPSIYASWHCITLTLILYFLMMSEFDRCFDTLSGLYNRAALDRVSKGLSKDKNLSIIMIDIDDFKMINDTYGHDYGDRVITQIATVIKESFSKHYKCFRLGGDEFVIISEEINPAEIEIHIHKMIMILSDMRIKGQVLPTVSYGYSLYKAGEVLDFTQVFKEADERMYQFKRSTH